MMSAVLLAVLPIGCNRTPPGPLPGIVTISNIESRCDGRGEIIDAHDGCLQYFNGRFYLYGTAYENSASYDGTSNRYRVYSSPDLAQWTYEGELFQTAPEGVYYRPYVIYNASTHKYVLWYNWYPKLWNGQTGVATSDTPVGPFTIVNPKVHLLATAPGDGSLFADDDGTAYFIYTALNEGGTIRIERLTADYLASTGEASGILAIGAESPLLFRRHNRYYALCGPRCFACPGGTEIQVLIASSPLGPYLAKSEGDINRQPRDNPLSNVKTETWAISVCSSNATGATDNPDGTKKRVSMIIRNINAPLIAAQETWVAKIPTAGEPLYVWMGDGWDSAPDHIRGHNLQYWSPPLKFGTNGDILPLELAPTWQLPPKTK
jgi:beta-xylosidase